VKEEDGSLLPSLERLVASVEEDKTVGAECGDALAVEEDGVDSSEFSASRGILQNRPGSHFSTRGKICIPLSENSDQEKRIQDRKIYNWYHTPSFLGN
jgi:hypothetical protein